LRAIAIAELPQKKAGQRFTRHAPLHRLTEGATVPLAQGYLARFGGNLPVEVQGAFPRFARAVRDAGRLVQAKRRLLPWLIRKGSAG